MTHARDILGASVSGDQGDCPLGTTRNLLQNATLPRLGDIENLPDT